MKILPYILIPILVLITSLVGSKITSLGMIWYKTISLPSWTPPGFVIGIVWTVIFILLIISMIIFWSKVPLGNVFYLISFLFVINLILNVLWSYLFFGVHLLGAAFFEAIVLDLSVIIIMIILYPFSKIASFLLLPYAVWTAFASYLTYSVWFLNR